MRDVYLTSVANHEKVMAFEPRSITGTGKHRGASECRNTGRPNGNG